MSESISDVHRRLLEATAELDRAHEVLQKSQFDQPAHDAHHVAAESAFDRAGAAELRVTVRNMLARWHRDAKRTLWEPTTPPTTIARRQ